MRYVMDTLDPFETMGPNKLRRYGRQRECGLKILRLMLKEIKDTRVRVLVEPLLEELEARHEDWKSRYYEEEELT